LDQQRDDKDRGLRLYRRRGHLTDEFW
jgi:hypothetical protein